MKRIHQVLLIVSFLPFCWLAMMAVHELGHMLGAYATGGQIARVILHPLAISRTDMAVNPHPIWVAWAGPLFGTVVPMLLCVVFQKKQWAGEYLVCFFAGFCLVSNGMYIGLGSFGAVGDAGDLLRYGSPIWLLWLFGIATVLPGFWFWNGLGPSFGLGNGGGKVNPTAAYVSSGLLAITILLELVLNAS
ncbi:MAG: hypothetical protein GXP26_01060 [Planctomycetes bacterium]|nr:hypothetical protein [Planctomycetota bacterium]